MDKTTNSYVTQLEYGDIAQHIIPKGTTVGSIASMFAGDTPYWMVGFRYADEPDIGVPKSKFYMDDYGIKVILSSKKDIDTLEYELNKRFYLYMSTRFADYSEFITKKNGTGDGV